MHCLLRRTYDATQLVRQHPPKLRDANKRLVYELCKGSDSAGEIEVTRWRAAELPECVPTEKPDVVPLAGYYDYAGASDGVWHVNFADPNLFVAYGSPLLAQDELQAAEHPALCSIREALLAEGDAALCEERNGTPVPMLVAGVERRCTVETAPDLDAGRVYGLYGNQFARAAPDVVQRAVRVHQPPPLSNLIAIAAPGGGRGEYMRATIERIVVTAYTGFAAAVAETARRWPGVATEVRTGFWGCGAFGGNRQLMTLLQLLAARLAGVGRVKFYAFDDAGHAAFVAGANALDSVLGGDRDIGDVLEQVADLDYVWGVSDGT
jgi:hypothetical protein